jgi:hypothetical protein
MAKNKVTADHHPTYSPDLASCNFLFRKINLNSKERDLMTFGDSAKFTEGTYQYYERAPKTAELSAPSINSQGDMMQNFIT